ncbi:sigma-70 family RNA polymerase sigma factor [Pseudenhygromyxa sp. WMMC2535]|nr:sigma-70 family RNA polymerase sigma factor [Pseudenhygromyxa sp. WMMC2535]
MIEGLRAGDSRAFERLVRAHVGPLRAAALRLLKDEADADDVVQEAFLSAFRSLDSFRGEARLGTWLHRIAINAALQRLRRRRREDESGQREDIEALLPRFLEDGHAEQLYRPWVQSADELVSRAETRKRVRELIDELPEGYRTVLILRDIEELDTAESADLLGISRGTLKVRLHRARQALRNLLERELELTGEP